MNVNSAVQRVCIWAAPACTAVFFAGFALAGYLVPPSPTRGAQETAAWYMENLTSIKLGLVFMCFAGGLWIIWSAAMTAQMLRIEGRYAPLAYTQLAMGACACIEFIMPAYFWLTAAYRVRDPEITLTLSDMGWLPFDGFVWTIIWQNAVIGVAVFLDRRDRPIFPRWYGYLSIWCSFAYLPAGFNVFFKDGPIAWNGAISWWVLLTAIFGWLMTTTYLLLKAVRHQEAEVAELDPQGEVTGMTLEERLARLERKLRESQNVSVVP